MAVKCPVCGKSTLSSFEICPICGWPNDYVQLEYPDMKNGDYAMPFNEARKACKEGREIY